MDRGSGYCWNMADTVRKQWLVSHMNKLHHCQVWEKPHVKIHLALKASPWLVHVRNIADCSKKHWKEEKCWVSTLHFRLRSYNDVSRLHCSVRQLSFHIQWSKGVRMKKTEKDSPKNLTPVFIRRCSARKGFVAGLWRVIENLWSSLELIRAPP